MKLLKSLTLFSMLAIGLTSYSQHEKQHLSPEEKAEKIANKLEEKLDLSGTQKKEIQQLFEGHLSEMSELKAQDIEKEEKKNAAKELREENMSQMEAILSDEQMTKYKELEREKREKMKARKEHRQMSSEERTKKHLQKIDEVVDLSDDQEAKLSIELMNIENDIKSIKSDPSYTDEEKKEQIKSTKKKFRSTLKEVLTEEQMEKLKKAKAERKH